MRRLSMDLKRVADCADFYRQFALKLKLECFGANLDALWDTLTAGVSLPLRLRLSHLRGHPQQSELEPIVAVMREAEQETGGAFSVEIR